MNHHSEVLISVLKAQGIDPANGAEIGVQTGKTSAALLAAFPRLTLLMIDPWRAPDANDSFTLSGDPTARQTDDQFYQAMLQSIVRTNFASKRASVLRETSQEAARGTPDGSLDFAFIDGDHSLAGVLRDAGLWWPKVRDGGVLFFHDYGSTASWAKGVQPAVDEFAASVGREVHTGERTVAWLTR